MNSYQYLSVAFVYLFYASTGIILPASAQANANTDQINVWVIDAQTQQVTSYSTGQWVDSYAELNGFGVGANLQVLVNGLPRSSVPMSPMQAGVSIIGLGEADVDSASYMGVNQLSLSPAASISTDTINVVMQVSPEIVEQGGAELRWQINGGSVNSVSLTPLSIPNSNGFVTKNFYLVADGTYFVQVSLYQSGVLVSETNGSYSITSDHPLKEKRDSDGDGVPDLIESELGLDPLNSDLLADSAGEGWSKFDVWLRCDELDINNCPLPLDTDCDGWSDVDEMWRGTNPADFILPSPNPVAECEDADETYNENKLALQERPAARRLYEREYVFSGDLGSNKIHTIESSEFSGIALFSFAQFADNTLLEQLGVNSTQLTPSVLLETAQRNLEAGTWPNIRLAAGNSLALRAQTAIEVPADNDNAENPSQQISMLVLEGKGDLNLQDFPASQSGQWTNIQQWREMLRTWMQQELVVQVSTPFSRQTNIAALLFEASLREEARLANKDEAIRLGEEATPAVWINRLQRDMQARENTTLFAWYQRLAQSLESVTNYQTLAASVQRFIDAMPITGTNTSEWLIERLRMPVVLAEQGCFINANDLAEIQSDPSFFEQYQGFCPQFYTDVELGQWQSQASFNRYLLRMSMYYEGVTKIANSASLADYEQDTDTDTLNNLDEVLRSAYSISTYPWLADSDLDGVNDNLDLCRIDPQNICSGDPIEPLLALGDNVQISVGSAGGIVMLEVVLSAPALEEISFNYFIEASLSDGDTAVDGDDFIAASGSLTFLPGQQSMLIPASLLANNQAGNVQFRLRVENIVNANLANNSNVQVVNVMRAENSSPNIMLAATSYNINERASLRFDASNSQSGIDNPALSFVWEQITGLPVSLSDSTSSMPSFTAPVITSAVDLVFSVTAQNADGEQASANVTVTVNPVDDPPVLVGEAIYSVARNATLTISKDDLLQFVDEPDGETLMVSELVQTVNAGGTLVDSALNFDFTPDASNGRHVRQLQNDPLDVSEWRDNGIAYRDVNRSADPLEYRIYTWTPEDGEVIVDQGTDSYSGILTNLDQSLLFYARRHPDTGNTVFEWVLPDGTQDELDVGGSSSLFGAQINSENGDFYHCMDSQWKRINPFTKSTDTIALSCSRFAAAQAQYNGDFCLTSEQGLHCSDDGVNFSAVYTLPNSSDNINRIFQNENHILVLYNDNNNQFIAEVSGEGDGQLLYTLDDYSYNLQGHWINDVFYTVLPVQDGLFIKGVQLFSWSQGNTQMQAIGEPQLMQENVVRYDLNSFVKLNDGFVWFGRKDSFDYAKYTVNPETGVFTQVGDDYSNNRTLTPWRDTALFSSARTESGGCNWFTLNDSGAIDDLNNPELADIGCFGRIVYGDTLAYTVFDNDRSLNEFFVKFGGEAISSVQFVVRITDENDNSVDLTVRIDITQGDE